MSSLMPVSNSLSLSSLSNENRTASSILRDIPFFGKDQWREECHVDVGEEPPLPDDILEILEAPCPFTRGKRVKQTHFLFLVPQKIDDLDLSLDYFQPYILDDISGIKKKMKSAPIAQNSYWALMAINVILDSRGEPHHKQLELMTHCAAEAHLLWRDYDAPEALEAVACTVLKYIITNKKILLFGQSPLTMTCCKETLNDRQIVVGGHTVEGLRISDEYSVFKSIFKNSDKKAIGIAPIRRFGKVKSSMTGNNTKSSFFNDLAILLASLK